MKKILCPTDFSDAAQNGIGYAAKLARVINGELTLFHVQSLREIASEDPGKSIEGIAKQLEMESEEVHRTFHVPCDSIVQSTIRQLSSVIQDVSDQYDLVVMGSNGPDDIYQFLTGTNAYNAAVKAKVPVIIVPENYVYSEIQKIVYAFDYLKERKIPHKELLSFASLLKAEITVLQIMEEAHSKGVDEDLRELQEIALNIFPGDVELKFDTIRSSEISQSINSYVSKNPPDMLALCSIHMNVFQRLFHKSVIKNLTATSDIPLFVFHA